MKARTLVPALALAAALLASPLAEARGRPPAPRGHRPPAHGYYGHRPSYGHSGHGYRPYSRGHRYYAPPAYYGYGYAPYGYGYGGYGYGGYGYGGYGYYPPPPPRYCPPRPRVGIWFGF
jgi:hypothetical protein